MLRSSLCARRTIPARSFFSTKSGGNSNSSSGEPRDAISLLEADHQKVRGVFAAFKVARTSQEKKDLVNQMVELLKVHTRIENDVFYAETRKLVPQLDQTVLESYVEHHVADVLCKELSAMSVDNESFVAETNVLIDNVTRHMDAEEKEWFPKVRQSVGDRKLQELGTRMAQMKSDGPGVAEGLKDVVKGIKSMF